MKKINFLMFWLLINNNLFAGEIKIYYPSGMQELCRTTPLIVEWTGPAVDVKVEIKKVSDTEYKSVYNYQISENSFQWIVNDAEYLNVPLSVRVSDLSDPNIFDEYHGVTVYGETEILSQTKSYQLCSGDDIYLQIDALGFGLSYQWFKDNEIINGATSSVLKIPNAEYLNSGVYICIIKSNSSCPLEQSEPISVYVATPTKFVTSPEEIFWEYNKSVNITAILHVNNESELDNVKFQWYKDTLVYIYNPKTKTFDSATVMMKLNESKKYYGTNSQELIIEKLVWDDRTNYYCVADGLCGSDTIRGVIGDDSRFEIIKLTPDYYGCEGRDIIFRAKLETKVEGNFTYQWYKAGLKRLNEGDKFTGTQTLELTIKNAVKSDEAAYYVMVTWREKSVYKRSEHFRYYPMTKPTISYQSEDWVINSKRNYYPKGILIYVYLSNYQPSIYEWYKDGKIIMKGKDSTTYRRLTAKTTDVGWYRCKIKNDCGETWSDSIYVAWGYPDAGNCLDKDVVINVDDFAPDYHYLWKKDGKILTDSGRIKGATTSTLVITNLEATDQGFYKVWVVQTSTGIQTLLGNIYVEARTAPFIVKDFPPEIYNEGDYIKLTPITALSQGNGLYYTLYFDGEPVGEEKFKPQDASMNIDYGFVMGGIKSNVKPGTYQYRFRNECGETWSTIMKVTNTAYKPGGIIEGGSDEPADNSEPNDDNIASDVNDNEFANNILIFPNPASDFITIQFQTSEVLETSEVSKVQIFSTLGIDVSPAGGGVNGVDGGGFRIDISHLPSGVYFIKIGDRVEKFVKM